MALGTRRLTNRASQKRRQSEGLENLNELLVWVEARTNRVLITTALRIHEKLKSAPPVGTPVDTGWASNSWIMSVDQPDTTNANPPKGAFSFLPSFNTGVVAVLQFDIKKNKSIFIQNNAPYINRLNHGWSAQSPSGFVDAAVDSGVAEVAREEG